MTMTKKQAAYIATHKADVAIAAAGKPIYIISGEGTGPGTIEEYKGTRTLRAIKMRLTKERCHGDRWAKAKAYSFTNEHGKVYVDLETGEYCFL